MNSEATIVSVVPFNITESKPGLNPGTFIIPKAPKDDFSILHVGISTFPVYLDGDRGSLAFPELGERVAGAVINDWNYAQIGINENSLPGLFVIPGKVTKEEILAKHKDKLEAAKETQREWFKRLVMMADDIYKKTGTHNSITDTQRVAAKELGHKAPWVL